MTMMMMMTSRSTGATTLAPQIERVKMSSSATIETAKITRRKSERRRKRVLIISSSFLDGIMMLLVVVVGMCLFSMTKTTTAFMTPPPLHPSSPAISFTRSIECSSTRNTFKRAFFITPPPPPTATVTALHATSPSNRNQQRQQQQQPQQQAEEEEALLSDVDARVLREILNDSKSLLDLETEEGIRSLLKRGTVKTVNTVNPKEQQPEPVEDSNSIFASTAMKAFTDSKLWKKLTMQAEDLLESAKIWVQNKVEQDVQTLAALGLFAWDRVVKDVARALPAAGSSARKLLLLTNTSSFNVMEQQEQQERKDRMSTLKEELNRPADEIKIVTRAIWDILSGASAESVTSTSSGRSLRTTAPAGIGNMAERQRRALQQRRKLEQQERDVTRVPGSVLEAGYELQRELQAETNVAGYKTKPIRQAIQAGVVGTLKAVQESTARLLAEQRKKADRLTGTVSSSSSSAYLPSQQQQTLNKTAMLLDLQQERLSIDLRLGKCIAEPENTWLTTDIVAQATMELNSEASLREIATFMVLVRDEMDAQVQADNNIDTTTTTTTENTIYSDNDETNESVVIMDATTMKTTTTTTTTTSAMVQEVLDQLRADLKSIQELRSRVAGAVSFVIAEQLYSQILGLPSATDEDNEMQILPLVLRLDEIQELLNAPPPPPPQVMPITEDDYDDVTSTMPFTAPTKFVDITNAKIPSSSSWATTGARANVRATAVDPATTPTTGWRQSSSTSTSAFIDFVDLIPDAVIDATMDGPETTATVGDAVAAFVDVGGKSFNAEIVTDDDFEIAVTKRVATFRGDDDNDDDDDAVSKKEEPNLVTVAVLRSLDVVFFVLEKFFTVAVPKAVMIGTNVVQRLTEAQQEGKGSKGWKPIRKTASAKGRY